MVYIIGIDDAGRGPVLGPMAIAGCIINEKLIPQLKELGVKDSKLLLPNKRQTLAKQIKELCEDISIRLTTAQEIDTTLNSGINLNKLEAIKCAQAINQLNLKNEKIRVIIDCPSVNIESWTETLKEFIQNPENLEISCEHKADLNHEIVSAASIIAKTSRDNEVEKLKQQLNIDFGSGYPSDPKTKDFLKNNYQDSKYKSIIRTTWKTYKNLINGKKQASLKDF